MADISENIGLYEAIPDSIRYQLLHRTASAVIEAKRFHARFAAIVVQSFLADDTQNHYQDFSTFIHLFGKIATKGKLVEISQVAGIRIFAAWVQSEPT